MRKIILLFVMITLVLGVFAQSKGKNAMTLRLVDIKVTDGALVNIAKEQEAKGNTKPMDMIRIYEGNVRAKLDEVAKASGRFEISDENTLDALTRDAEASLFMKMSRAEKIEYVSSKQNDYTLSCDIGSCQFTRKAGPWRRRPLRTAGWTTPPSATRTASAACSAPGARCMRGRAARFADRAGTS